MDKNPDTYDVLIVGAGISGLYTGIELLRKKRGLRIAIADRYKFLGGRTFTFNADISGQHYQWEEGAGRISKDHRMLLALARRHKMGLIPIDGDMKFKVAGRPFEPDSFTAALPTTLEPLLQLPKAVLAKTTIRKLVEGFLGKKETEEFFVRYPYRAELDIMRADMALQLFVSEFKSFSGYFILREGFSELIHRMESEFKRRGGILLPQHELQNFSEKGCLAKFSVGPPSEKSSRPISEIHTRKLILAIPSAAARRLPPLAALGLLKRLSMQPLLRVYAAFPPGTAALQDLPKFATPSPNRFIIPGNLKQGVVQISYTDSTDAEPLMDLLEKKGEAALQKYLVDELSAVLGKELPDPLFIKAHSWKEGVTYWLPGDYDPYALSREACRPMPAEYPALHLCGESYSTRQCWVEGALEHAALLLRTL